MGFKLIGWAFSFKGGYSGVFERTLVSVGIFSSLASVLGGTKVTWPFLRSVFFSTVERCMEFGTFAVSCIESSLIFSRSGIGEIGVGISVDGNFGHAPISIGLSVSFSGFSGFSDFSSFSGFPDFFEFGSSVEIVSGILAGDGGLQGVPVLDITYLDMYRVIGLELIHFRLTIFHD